MYLCSLEIKLQVIFHYIYCIEKLFYFSTFLFSFDLILVIEIDLRDLIYITSSD